MEQGAFIIQELTGDWPVYPGHPLEWLCHQIAKRLGWEHAGPATSRRVLRALAKTPGRLVKGLVRMPGDCCARGQSALHFELPEPERAFMMGVLRQGKKPEWSTFNKS